MKKVLPSLIFLVIIASFLLTGCTGTGVATSWPGITVAQGRVYLSYATEVFALNPDNGTMIWRYPEKPNAKVMYYAPSGLTSDGILVVGDYQHTIHGLNADTGVQTWTYQTGNRIVAAPLVVEDLVLVPSTDGNLYALDSKGTLIWKFTTDSSLWAQPAFYDGVIYLSAMDHKMYALSIKDGSQLWSADLGSAAISNPSIEPGKALYVGTIGGDLIGLDIKSGNQLWKHSSDFGIWATPMIKDNMLYYGDLDGNFIAFDTTKKQPVWQYKAGGAIVSAALLKDDRILFSSENGVLNIVGYDGKVILSPAISEKLYGSPVSTNGYTLVGVTTSKDKILSALDENGNQVWAFQVPK